jgi:hypothetical protein
MGAGLTPARLTGLTPFSPQAPQDYQGPGCACR